MSYGHDKCRKWNTGGRNNDAERINTKNIKLRTRMKIVTTLNVKNTTKLHDVRCGDRTLANQQEKRQLRKPYGPRISCFAK
jgi:hypothetical protein